ncbi:MAG TPA: DUF1579 family protein [Rhizomicrobium sp.]|jgi:hypothetical protein|nr:DUF1579 family protein [Rhizomicrobium sp.]
MHWLPKIGPSTALLFAMLSGAQAAEPSLYDRVDAKLARDPKLAAQLGKPALEMKSLAFMVGDWDVTTTVFATAKRKASVSHGKSHIAQRLGGVWLAQSDTYDGAEQDQTWTTFNPVIRRFVSMSIDVTGNSVRTDAAGWRGNRLVYEGTVEIVGERVTLRQTMTRRSDHEFALLN